MNRQPIYTMQGNVPVVLYSCGVCQCYIGKCTAASFPADEVPVCKQCRDEHGYGDRPIHQADLAPVEALAELSCNSYLDDDAPADYDADGPNPCVCGRRDQCTYWEGPCPYRFDDEDLEGADDRPVGDRFF